MSFDGWLAARESAAVEREWATLGATRVAIGEWSPRVLAIRPEGAALLAAAMLGCSPERFAWFAGERSAWPPAIYTESRTVSRSFLDHEHELGEPDCSEAWQLREVLDGARGVQHITIDCAWGEMTREGGNGRSVTFVRVYDRGASRAVSIPLYSTAVWMVGEIDLAPLDLFALRTTFKLAWRTYNPDALRGVLAQLAADLDAHFDTCTMWPGGVTDDEVIENRDRGYRVRRRVHRFEAGAYAIELDELLGDPERQTGWLIANVHGLPWGHELRVRFDHAGDPVWGVKGWVDLTLPRAQLDATLARLAAIPHIAVT